MSKFIATDLLFGHRDEFNRASLSAEDRVRIEGRIFRASLLALGFAVVAVQATGSFDQVQRHEAGKQISLPTPPL